MNPAPTGDNGDIVEGENVYAYPGIDQAENFTKPLLKNTIKVGIIDDSTHAYGTLTYYGAFIKAMYINLAGGVDVNGTQMMIGLTSEDSRESEYNADVAIEAALALIAKDPDVIIGGFRSEMVSAYMPRIMQAGIPFIGTGAATTSFTTINVKNGIWPYFFRVGPTNSYFLGAHMAHVLTEYLIPQMNDDGKNVSGVTIIYEELMWTIDVKNYLLEQLNASFGLKELENITLVPVTDSWDKMMFDANWAAIETREDQLVIPIISALDLGTYLGAGYNETKPNAVFFGINVASTLDGYLGGGQQYEGGLAGVMRVNNTQEALTFFDTFESIVKHVPVYTSGGAYNAITLIAHAAADAGSLEVDAIVASLEGIDTDNPIQLMAQTGAFDEYHDIVGWSEGETVPAGWPTYGAALFWQFNSTGGAFVIPSAGIHNGWDALYVEDFIYPDWW